MSHFAELMDRNRISNSPSRKVATRHACVDRIVDCLSACPLFWIIGYVVLKGGTNLNLDFFIHCPPDRISGGACFSASKAPWW